MANTKFSLFPFSGIILEKVLIYPCSLEFSGALENGKYVFSGNEKKFDRLSMGQTGVIAGVMVSGNCTPADFAAAVDEPLQLQVYHGRNRTPINLSPFYFSQFSDGDNFTLDWKITGTTETHADIFYLGVEGKVNQIDAMTEDELKIKISFNFMRVDNKELERVRNLMR